MPVVEKRKGVAKAQHAKITFDIGMVNAFIQYLRCEYVSAQDRLYLYQMIKSLDLETYRYSPDIHERLEVVKALLEAQVDEKLSDDNLIHSYITSHVPDSERILKAVGFGKNSLSSAECEYIGKAIYARVQHLEIYKVKDDIIKILNNLDNSSYEVSYYKLIQDLKDKMSLLMSNLQGPATDVGLIREFSFSDETFAKLIDVIVKKRKRPASILQTGIRQLNAILSGGFQSTRLYTIIGGSGRFKSGTLLNLADQIRRYNPQIVPFENGLRKTVLFITLENSIEESVERIYDMYSDINNELRDQETSDVINLFRNEGGFSFTGEAGIDIDFVYRGNLEIDTSAIYGMVQSLVDKGKQPICIVLDYIKRINSAHPSNGDERVRMSYVAKELKAIAQYFEIPVITAMQLNREGNSIIDAAMRENKQDVARFVGSSSIGNAWDIIEDSDWVGLINLEAQKSTGQLFLTFKRLKIRGKSAIQCVDYFNHPFVNEKNIRLMPDVNLENPVSVISLASDLESIDEKEDLQGPKIQRPMISNMRSDDTFRSRTPMRLPEIPISAIT